MGLDFSKSTSGSTGTTDSGTGAAKDEIAVVEQYDIVADRKQMNAELVNSDEVDRIVSTIEVNNLETIVIFWSRGCRRNLESIGCRLNSMNMSQLDDTSEMLKTLAKIMDQFDIEEIKDNPGLFRKVVWKYEKTAR